MMKKPLAFGFWLISMGLLIGLANAEGLNVKNYGEVLVENVAIGQSYSMIEVMNLPFEVVYKGDKPTRLILKTEPPLLKELKPGFEPIPDSSWVSLGNSIAAIAANGTYKTDVRITIPKDKKYLGKKYQVQLMVRLYDEQASMMAVSLGIVGRLLITIADVENPVRSNENISANMNFNFVPGLAEVKEVKLGEKVKIVVEKDKLVQVKNFSDKKISGELVSLDPKKTLQNIYKDYEACPNPEFLHFAKNEISVAPGQEQPLDMWLEIPNQPEYKGKKYQFTVSIETSGTTGGSRYMRILVNTAK